MTQFIVGIIVGSLFSFCVTVVSTVLYADYQKNKPIKANTRNVERT